jgi:hypothetical protein
MAEQILVAARWSGGGDRGEEICEMRGYLFYNYMPENRWRQRRRRFHRRQWRRRGGVEP